MGGNRSPVSSLDGPSPATELHPHGGRAAGDAVQVKPDFRRRQADGRGVMRRLTRFNRPPNTCRTADRSKARHRDRPRRRPCKHGTGKWVQPGHMDGSPSRSRESTQGHLPMEDDVTPLVGFMVDPNAAQIVFVALTKLVSALDCGCPDCRRDLPDMDAGTRDEVRERDGDDRGARRAAGRD